MFAENDFIVADCPGSLQQVDVVKVCFLIEFISPCSLQPADFLGLGRTMRMIGRHSLDPDDGLASQQLRTLFQPPISTDPVARRKFQKPSPAFVMTMPIMAKTSFADSDPLELEVLFLGNGIPLIGDFLRCLIHLGHLGMVAGAGRFTVKAVYSQDTDLSQKRAWGQGEPVNNLTCSVQSLAWLLEAKRVVAPVVVKYVTPVRLMVDGKPLRKPSFAQVFPFMLRRVTSMICTHSDIELLEEPEELLVAAQSLTVTSARLTWHDWRSLSGRQGLVVGGFMGEMCLSGASLEKIYWVLATASLFNIGKGATYGAGQFMFDS